MEFNTSGTLGDCYILIGQLLLIKEKVKLYHCTKHKYWEDEIRSILKLAGEHIEIEFVDEPVEGLQELKRNRFSNIYFPVFDIPAYFDSDFKYEVLQPHSGKLDGHNRKALKHNEIQEYIDKHAKYEVVVLGTDKKYEDINNCINLVGKTNVIEVIPIIRDAEYFTGPEGYLSFIALSAKVRSTIYYTSGEAVRKRIIGTPWDKYCDLLRL